MVTVKNHVLRINTRVLVSP